jgi:hypothetical protein
MSDGKKQGDENWRDATPDDVFKVLRGETVRARVKKEANENWVSTDVDGYDLHITGWHRDRFIDSEGSHWAQCQVYCEPAPTRSPKDGCRILEDNEEPMPGDFINWGAGWNELTAAMFPLALIPSWYCRPIKEQISKSDRPVPKGFRLLGDEPRLASDGYWSLSCKDWLVIGDRVEEANRDKWPAIRLVVDEPEPVKQLVLVCDHDISDQALYVDGILQDFDETIYGTNIAKLAKGSLIRFNSYEVSAPKEWPRVLSDLGKLDGKQLEDPSVGPEPVKQHFVLDQNPASVFGSNPIEVRPIMQIRLPVPASVLGKLGDMLEKHYPGSTMRQVGGFLVFEESIES